MTREERERRFAARTDTVHARRRETAKKVAALLAESAATLPDTRPQSSLSGCHNPLPPGCRRG